MRESVFLALLLAAAVAVSGCTVPTSPGPGQDNNVIIKDVAEREQACKDAGGTVRTLVCCMGTGDFPNLCLLGPCGCDPVQSEDTRICDCGEGRCFNGTACVEDLNSFLECVEAGYPILESLPRVCRTPDGREFIEESCSAPAGKMMTLSEALEIAISSDCEGPLLDTAVCNPETGTWWIDLGIEQEGCSPACVVHTETGAAEINWRCTGLLP